MSFAIRRATPDDIPALAELGATTFVETFGHLYRPEDLQSFLEESHSEAAYARVLAVETAQSERSMAHVEDSAWVQPADEQL